MTAPERHYRPVTPHLDRWRAELRAGTRGKETYDALWSAACYEAWACEYAAAGVEAWTERCLWQAREVMRHAGVGKHLAVRLTPAEIAQARAQAHAQNKKLPGVHNPKAAPDRSDFSIKLQGALAEIAVARFLGGTVNDSVNPHGGDHGAGDVLLPDGRDVSVKCRSLATYDFALMGTDPAEFRAALGVLCYTMGPRTVVLTGWCTRAEFVAQARVVDYGHGQRLALGPEAFRAFPITAL